MASLNRGLRKLKRVVKQVTSKRQDVLKPYEQQLTDILGHGWAVVRDYGNGYTFKLNYGYDYSSRQTFRLLTLSGKVISEFTMRQMPGCCGIVVSTGSTVDPKYRGKGIGTILNELRKDIARANGFGCLMCTTILSNTPQQKILERNEWELVNTFNNPRTGNDLGVHIYNLNEQDRNT